MCVCVGGGGVVGVGVGVWVGGCASKVILFAVLFVPVLYYCNVLNV